MSNEFELINHNTVNNFYAFVIDLKYRRPHLHTDIEIIIVLKGNLKVTSEDKEIIVDTNQLIILNTCQLHELSSNEGALLLIFQFGLTLFEKAIPQIYELSFATTPYTLSNNHNCKKLVQYIIDVSYSYFSDIDHNSLICHGLASLIMFELLQKIPYKLISEDKKNSLLSKKNRIKRISDYIQLNYQKKLLLSEIAEKEKLSVPYLSHFFRDNFGLSFQEYLNMIRCEKARYLLFNSNSNLLIISELCGFSDTKYLNRAFKKLYGLTPKEFRDSIDKTLIFRFDSKNAHKIEQQILFSKEKSLSTIGNFLTNSFLEPKRKRLLH